MLNCNHGRATVQRETATRRQRAIDCERYSGNRGLCGPPARARQEGNGHSRGGRDVRTIRGRNERRPNVKGYGTDGWMDRRWALRASSATRVATVVAATRRGCVHTTTRSPAVQPCTQQDTPARSHSTQPLMHKHTRMHTHTHAHTHARLHTRTHARTHTHRTLARTDTHTHASTRTRARAQPPYDH